VRSHFIDSVCTYCGVGCDIAAHVENNQIIKVTARENGKVSQGKLCIKGKEGHHYLTSDKRLGGHRVKKSFIDKNAQLFSYLLQKNTLKSIDDNYYSVDLDTAVELAALKLRSIKEESGADSIACVGGARTSCESGYLFQKFCREVLQSPNIDNCARVCHSPSLAGLKVTLGEGAATNPFDDILEAEFLLVIGSNTTEAHPIVANRILKARQNGTTLAVADVREIQLSKKANYHLSLPPEANLMFLNMLAYTIITEKLYDESFIEKRTSGWGEYKESILNDPYANPEFFKKLAGYESLAIATKEIARSYAKSRSMILWGLGISEHIDGSRAVSAIANLALLTGNVGKVGAGLMPLRGQNNVQGACDVGCLPYYGPDYSKPAREGLKTPDVMNAIADGKVKAIVNMGEDLTHIHANLNKVVDAVDSLDFLAVLEVVEASMTRRADIVFAVKSAYEKSGVYVNAERRLHLSRPLVKSDLPDDWEVLEMIANRFGAGWKYENSQRLWDETRSVVKRFEGASYELLSANNDGLQWPVSSGGDMPRLHLEKFRTPDGFGHFKYYPYKIRGFVKALSDGKKPKLTLTTGRVIAHYNNASQTKLSPKLLGSYPEDVVLISHEDAKSLNLNLSYPVVLVSKYGESTPLRVKESKTIKRGTLYASYHFESSRINYLFGDESDSVTKTPRFKAVEVELRQGLFD